MARTRLTRIASMLLAAGCLSLSAGLPAVAQDDEETSPMDLSEREPGARLLARMHMLDQFEIMTGEMAVSEAESDRVRRLGERVMGDHIVIDERVLALAEELGISLPDPDFATLLEKDAGELTSMQEMIVSALEKLLGGEDLRFDEVYVRAVRKSHTRAINILQADLAETDDDQIRELVADILPILEQHRELAAILEREMASEWES